MKRKHTAIILLLSLVFTTAGGIAELTLPKAPDGYQWIRILDDKAALLKPDGWFFREEHRKNTDAYFVSRENIEKGGKFSTGLSLNILYHINSKGVTPSTYALAFVKKMKASKEVEVIQANADKASGFTRVIVKARVKHPEGDMISHISLFANDDTGTLWYYHYEAPVEEWAEAWKTGRTIMKLVVLDTTL